jgi:hypothetical protein
LTRSEQDYLFTFEIIQTIQSRIMFLSLDCRFAVVITVSFVSMVAAEAFWLISQQFSCVIQKASVIDVVENIRSRMLQFFSSSKSDMIFINSQ